MTAVLTAEPQAADLHPDWDWADNLFQGSDWYDLVENQVDEAEFLPEVGYVYQLDTGLCIVVTTGGDVQLGDPSEADS